MKLLGLIIALEHSDLIVGSVSALLSWSKSTFMVAIRFSFSFVVLETSSLSANLKLSSAIASSFVPISMFSVARTMATSTIAACEIAQT